MTELPYMSVQVADAIADDEGLTNEQLGALERIRRVLWRRVTAETLAPSMTLAEAKSVSRLGRRWGMASPALLARLLVDDAGMVSDPKLTERLARTRKLRQARAEAAAARWGRSEVPQNSMTVAQRSPRKSLKSPGLDADLLGPSYSNQNQNTDSHRQNSPSGQAAGSAEEARSQHDALYKHGAALLVERTGVSHLQARKNLNAWLAIMGGDAEATAMLLYRARDLGLTGQAFNITVAQSAQAAERERTKGLSLPLGPAVVRGGKR